MLVNNGVATTRSGRCATTRVLMAVRLFFFLMIDVINLLARADVGRLLQMPLCAVKYTCF
jgi:hypothetical protein